MITRTHAALCKLLRKPGSEAGTQDYAAAIIWAFPLGKLVTQQILGEVQQ